MSVQEILKAIELDEKLALAERQGVRAIESEASQRGREALARIARNDLRVRVAPRMQVRRVAR
jgi:hypothetical protein